VSAPVKDTQVATAPHKSSVPALREERPVAWPKRTVRPLANGMQVVLAESRAFPKITAQLFFRTGNSSVALTTPGLADMTAKVVRTGTKTRTSRQIEEDLRRMGGDLGTSAGADNSGISISGLAEFSDGLLELVADLARNASFPAEEFERERRQKLEGLRVERTTPGFLASERLRQVLFGKHPYSIISPTEKQLAAYELAQLKDFYAKAYSPSDALLIVVGDFAGDEMMKLVEKHFGAWKSPAPAPLKGEAPPQYVGRHVHLVHLPGAVQTQIVIGNMAITRRDPDWFRVLLANAIYGGAFHSRLVINIREQKGYTYSPRSGVNSLRDYGYFTVSAAVRNEVVGASLTEMFYELDKMRALPVTNEELESARAYLSGVFSLGVATQDGVLGQLSSVYLDRMPEDYIETYRERIHLLTAQDVMAAARRHFDSANVQIVVVGDREHIAEQAMMFGPVTSYDAHGAKQ
jgi:zinc protease